MARRHRFGNDKTLEVPSIDGQSCLMGIRQQYQKLTRTRLCRDPELATARCRQRAQAWASRQKCKAWVRVGDERFIGRQRRATRRVMAETISA
jgi:hypothetical protein